MGATFSQFFPPSPTLTERNIPSQQGKVFIVTGGASGVGLELCAILYRAGGKVYLAGRSKANAEAAIADIISQPCSSPGELTFLDIHLDDLSTIKAAVQQFTSVESRLDVLFNNAGVSNPPRDILSPQGHEMQMATNCLGPYLLTQLLLPTLLHTSQISPPNSVRVVWTSSIVVDASAPVGGIVQSEVAVEPPSDTQRCYTTSKVGNLFLASELARQVGEPSILSVAQNPGNLKTPLLRYMPWWVGFLSSPLLYHPRFGAYTELWAGLSTELGVNDSGGYILPWGRRHPAMREDLINACKTIDQGGSGMAPWFAEWCEKQTERFR